MAKLNGAGFQTLVTEILNNFTIPDVYFYQLLNIARSNREAQRPWKCLQKLDSSQSANTSTVYTTQKTLPSDFRRFVKAGHLLLFDGNQTYLDYTEIPWNLQVQYKDSSTYFFIDQANLKFYLCGTVDRTYSIYNFYVANYGNITAATTWLQFPEEYDAILAFDVATMWRLGNDYDDTNARNADKNAQTAELIYNSMKIWDDELALSAVTEMDYPIIGEGSGHIANKINIDY